MTISPDWIPFLRKFPFFAGFREEDLRLFTEKMEMLSLPRGAVVCRAGEDTDAFYLVLSGRARKVEPGREAKTVAFLSRGDALGEMGMLTGEPRIHTTIVEATAEFLVLHKKDFDDILAKAPHLAVPISRLLSTRLLEARRHLPTSGPTAQIYVLLGPASPADQVVLAVNLGIALAEQTRKRVLLMDILENGRSGVFARALGLDPVRVGEHGLREEDLLNPDMIHRLCAAHPSGLELLSLPRSLMEGKFAGLIYSFLNGLRRSHDFVVAVVAGPEAPSAKAALEEADRVLLAEKSGTPSLEASARQATAAGVPPDRQWTIRLEEGPFSPGGTDVFRVPWKSVLTPGRSPVLTPDAEPARLVLNRLARRMGGVSLGFAMGAGAALGYVLVGFLKVLEKYGIYPDVIAGTSMGALIGSFYAAGKSPAEIEQIALSVNKSKIWSLMDFMIPIPRQGILMGAQVLKFLKTTMGARTFADLNLPFACVATDIMNGEEVVLNQGKVAEAVRASLSLPFFFRPAFLNGRYLVDGGLVNPVPTSVVAAMGADVLVAVNTTAKPSEKRIPGFHRRKIRRAGFWKGPNILQVMIKTIDTMQFGIAQTRKEPAQLILEPDVSAFTWADFHRAGDIIRLGEDYIEPMIPKIKSFFPYFNPPAK